MSVRRMVKFELLQRRGQHHYQNNRVETAAKFEPASFIQSVTALNRHVVHPFIVVYLYVLGIAELANILFTFPQQNKECISQPIMEKTASPHDSSRQ